MTSAPGPRKRGGRTGAPKGPQLAADLAFWRSPLARRLALLFLLCALLPILLLGFLSYRQVTENLRQQSRQRLYQQTKAVAMSVVERLLLLEASLELAVTDLEATGTMSEGVRVVLARQYRSATWTSAASELRVLLGRAIDPPSLAPAERQHLAAGRSLIVTRAEEHFPRVLIGRGGAADAVLWGDVRPEYLWSIGAQSTLPPHAELAVVARDGAFLVRSELVPTAFATRLAARVANAESQPFTWRDDYGDVYLASHWTIPMETNYRAGAWIVSLSQGQAYVLAPLGRFRTNFWLIVSLSALALLLFSVHQIRRGLEPLERLRAGTRRIAQRDFATRVQVSSGDEIEELAAAFNAMAGQLGRQFQALSTMAAVGHQVLAGGDRDTVVSALLSDLARVVPCRSAQVTVVEETPPRVCRFRWQGAGGADPAAGTVTADQIAGPAAIPDSENAPIEPGWQSVLTLPVMTGDAHLGSLSVAAPAAEAFDDEHRRLLAELADHLALALVQLRLRAALEAERERLRAVVEHLPNGVLVLDGSGRVLLANRLGRRDLPAIAGVGIGEPLTRLGDRPLAAFGAGGEEVGWDQVELHDPERVFIVAVAPLAWRAGDRGSVIVLRDVTREREAEERLQRQERLATVGQLAAGIAHDLNNMLQGILLATQALVLGGQLPEDGEAGIILQQCRRAAELIRRILDFSRRSAFRPAPLDLGLLVAESVHMLRRTLPATIELVTELAPGLIITADAVQVQQVVTNLVVNARDAMAAGGTLRVTLDREEAAARATGGTRRWARLTVADTGSGIPADIRSRIFDPFFTTKDLGVGTGLGLAQVHGIVARHEGAIDVASGDGGSTFTIRLPLTETLKPMPAERQPALSGSGQLVLVVDDDAVVRDVVELGLQRAGYRALKAADGAEALTLFAEHDEIALVITDVRMPELDGTQLAERLKALRSDVRIVLMTGYAEGELEPIDHDAIDGWLTKPFTLEDLAAAIARAG